MNSENILDADDKKEEYKHYILDHQNRVNEVWESLCRLFPDDFADDFFYWQVQGLVEIHDKSKYSAEEFEAYRMKFFPAMEDQDMPKEWFDHAWNHHQKSNPHHWQYWIMWTPEMSIALKMPLVYIIEMLCDWGAMSSKFKDTPSAFYEKEKKKMYLHKETRSIVEAWLPKVDKAALAVSN